MIFFNKKAGMNIMPAHKWFLIGLYFFIRRNMACFNT